MLHQELIHFNDDNNSNNIYFELMKKLSFFVPYKFGVLWEKKNITELGNIEFANENKIQRRLDKYNEDGK